MQETTFLHHDPRFVSQGSVLVIVGACAPRDGKRLGRKVVLPLWTLKRLIFEHLT
jgi:hypothetical protein